MSAFGGKADIVSMGVLCPLLTVVSIDRRNTLIFEAKMECGDETKTSTVFYERTEVRDMGSLATRRVHEFDWARV